MWREADLEVKMLKAPSLSEHFWKLTCRKSARHCGAKRVAKSKSAKHTTFGALLKVEMWKKQRETVKHVKLCKKLWKVRCWKSARRCGAKHIAKSKFVKHATVGALLEVTFGCSTVILCGRRNGFCTLPKVSKNVREGFVAVSAPWEAWDDQRCISRGRRSARNLFIRDFRRSGRWFPDGLHFGASDLQVS